MWPAETRTRLETIGYAKSPEAEKATGASNTAGRMRRRAGRDQFAKVGNPLCRISVWEGWSRAPPLHYPMNLADVFTVVLVILGLLAVFVGVWLMAAALFPARIERCGAQISGAPLKCLLVGVVVMVPLIAAGGFFGKVATNVPGKLLSVAIIVFAIVAALVGTAGLALRIGRGLPARIDQDEPWRRVWRGGVVLAISYGTVVLLPVTLVAGFGALVLSWFERATPVTPPLATAP